MKINPIYKVRNVAGEDIVLLQGKTGADMTRVVGFNASALLLWNSLQGKEFTCADAVKVLMDNYEVDEATATADVEQWIETMCSSGLLMSEE